MGLIEFEINTRQRDDWVELDGYLEEALRRSGLRDGALIAFSPHTTAGITINENADPSVREDISASLDRQVPWQDHYQHTEGNSAAHIKASLIGSSAAVPVTDGRLRLGTWQSVYFAEFDGPRRRRVWILPIQSAGV